MNSRPWCSGVFGFGRIRLTSVYHIYISIERIRLTSQLGSDIGALIGNIGDIKFG